MRLGFLFKKSDTEIILLKQSEKAILFYVKNGKGLLHEKYGAHKESGLSCLFFDKIPLIKFHGDEYMCPTCEQLISAGYGLDSAEENKKLLTELSEKLNGTFADIETSFHHLKPLLGLLQTGYYQLSDEALSPTNGNGHFFWAINNTPQANPASIPFWEHDLDYSTPKPQYLLPSQAPDRLNMERVKHYQQQQNHRAIAYYHTGGYLCTLLDGHHKATASALEAKPINTLLISKPKGIAYRNDAPKSLIFSHFSLTEKEFITNFEQYIQQHNVYKPMTEEETQHVLNLKNTVFDQYQWDHQLLATAHHYHDVMALVALEFAGDLSEQRLNDILTFRELVQAPLVNYISKALFITKHNMATTFSIQASKNHIYQESWFDLFTQLSQHPSDQVSDFFVEYLINDDGQRPWLTKIADTYFLHLVKN